MNPLIVEDQVLASGVQNLIEITSQYVDEIFIFHSEWTDSDFDGNFDKCYWHDVGKSCPVHDKE